jgi:basic amino acid/polyamine antiporter, APA family
VTQQSSDTHAQPQLARRLTLPLLILYGLGVTVGAGIYVLIGEIGHDAGLFAPYAFLLAALLIAPTTYSFSKLVTRFPVSAGEARYVEEGFRIKWLAIVVGLLVVSAGIVSSATISVGSIGYVQEFVTIPAAVLVTGIIVTFTVLAIIGIRASVGVAALFTLIEVGGLIIIIVGGFIADTPAIWHGVTAPFATFDLSAIGLVSASAVLAFYAFIGFEDMVNVAEEVKEPEKIFPAAIAVTLLVTMVLYFLVSTIAVSLVDPETLGTSGAPISLIAERTGLISPDLLSGIGVMAALNGILIQIIMASRVLYGLSRQAEMPRFLSYVHPRTHTPVTATLIVAGVTLVLALAFPLARLAETTSQITFVVFTLVNGALIAITLREAGWRLSAVPSFISIAIPAVGALGSVALMLVSLV